MSLIGLARARLAKLAADETARETTVKHARACSGGEPCFTVSLLGPETVKQPPSSAAVRAPDALAGPDPETWDETFLKQPWAVALPEPWREGLARLAAMPEPPGWPYWRSWPRVRADAIELGERWGGAATALGWDAVDLWGCNPDPGARRLDRDGLALLLDGGTVAELHADRAVILADASRLTYRRTSLPGAVPLWALAPA